MLTTATPAPLAPDGRRLALLAATATVVGAALVAVPLDPPPSRPAALADWWDHIGTAEATMSLLRMVGLITVAWMWSLVALGMAATTRRGRAVAAWHRFTPIGIRRALLAAACTISASSPAAALAQEGEGDVVVPVLHDLGPDEGDATPALPALIDLGPHQQADPSAPGEEAPTMVARDATAAADDVWMVERGDHLWRIAEVTLVDRGEPSDDAHVLDYWRTLIDHNRSTIGPDPDLIHPGTVIRLP
jgi:hypothetical protein